MTFNTFDLGLSNYEDSLAFQKDIFTRVKEKTLGPSLIINQHNPVITLGRLADKNNILASQEMLKERNIRILQTERGGDVTYHGPGQLTIYPIFDLKDLKKDVHFYLRFLEQAVIDFLGQQGVSAQRQPKKTGVWIKNKKIASVGISIRQWISFHGISLNITKSDLENFKLIRPCGMQVEMTCLESALSKALDPKKLQEPLIAQFNTTLNNFYNN